MQKEEVLSPVDSLTPQQRTAVEARKTAVVLASGAGCGKTHVLTERYLSHLTKDGAAVGQVVAISFTDRAAREMRERIRTAIEARPEASEHLRALDSAPISTFHSFCGNLLRQFAIPAGLDPAFEVLDEVLAANLRTEAIAHYLRALLAEEKPHSSEASALRELAVLFGFPAVSEAVDSLLLDVDRPTWRAWLDRSPQDVADAWFTFERELLPNWVAYLCAASPKIARCLSLLERVTSPNPEVQKRIARLRSEVPRLHEAPNLALAIEEMTELAKVGRSGKKDWPDEAVYAAVKKAFEDFRADLPKRFEAFLTSRTGVAEAARVGQLFLQIASAADEEYRRRKSRAGALDFQDMLATARNLLRDSTEVREALRNRYRFLLVDEFQDTDPVQMELVELLGGSVREGAKLFAVGDRKQSIYRFRGAEVKLFNELRTSVASEGQLGLTRNFRSQPGILHFVNALFSKRIPEYDALEPHRESTSADANVEFLWTAVQDDPANPDSDSATVSSQRTAEAEAIARRIVALLEDATPRTLAENGPPRRIERGDIVLLFRSMTHAAIYETALRRHGLDYYLVGGRAFFAQQEVYDVLNVLRALENPHDSASLVGALRSPFFNLSDESIFLLATHDECPWAGLNDSARIAILPEDERAAAARAAICLAAWRAKKDTLPIAALLNEILAASGYDAALQFEFLGDRKLANLWKLIDLARSFDRTGLFGLHEFTARLGDLIVRQPREEQAATLPERADVVRLMSIHQAKGLEFPVVFVPDFAAQGRGDRHPAARWHRGLGCLAALPAEFEYLLKRDASEDAEEPLEDREELPFSPYADELGRTADRLEDWQEDLRVLYVACTRARDLLVLSSGLPRTLELGEQLPACHLTLTLEERFDVRTGECIAEDIDRRNIPFVKVIFGDRFDGDPDLPLLPEPTVKPSRVWKLPAVPTARPTVFSLGFLEARARGEAPIYAEEQFDSEDDADRANWRTLRERVGPVSLSVTILWNVLERWDFADVDGWMQLLSEALDEANDRRLSEKLQAQLRRFAESPLLKALANAEDVNRNVEFIVELEALVQNAQPIKIRGLIDLLYRDSLGWHVLGIDSGTVVEGDPWRGRQPGLILQASAASAQLGELPQTIELFDLATGQHLQADPQRFSLQDVCGHFRCFVE